MQSREHCTEYLRATEIELASGAKPEHVSYALPPFLVEKLQQFVAAEEAKDVRGVRELIPKLVRWTITEEFGSNAKRHFGELAQFLRIYVRLVELEIAIGEKPERGSIALPTNMFEEIQQYLMAMDAETSESEALAEDDGEYWEEQEEGGSGVTPSELEAQVEELIATGELTEEEAANSRDVVRKVA